jgi:hypothetical protein
MPITTCYPSCSILMYLRLLCARLTGDEQQFFALWSDIPTFQFGCRGQRQCKRQKGGSRCGGTQWTVSYYSHNSSATVALTAVSQPKEIPSEILSVNKCLRNRVLIATETWHWCVVREILSMNKCLRNRVLIATETWHWCVVHCPEHCN